MCDWPGCAVKEHCHAALDGDCTDNGCPQLKDNEPNASGRSCPLPDYPEGD